MSTRQAPRGRVGLWATVTTGTVNTQLRGVTGIHNIHTGNVCAEKLLRRGFGRD